jgi:hypothetical protein
MTDTTADGMAGPVPSLPSRRPPLAWCDECDDYRYDAGPTPGACHVCTTALGPVECDGHEAGPFDPMGVTVYCDGSCLTAYPSNAHADARAALTGAGA